MDDETSKEEEARPLKRLRTEDDGPVVVLDNDEDALLMLAMMEGNKGNEQEEAERRRRLERRKRWKTVNEDQEDMVVRDAPQTKDPTTPLQQLPDEVQGAPAAVPHEESIDKVTEEDEFDIFSSSVSPVMTAKTTQAKAATADAQKDALDYDDAEGYYKPVINEEVSLGYASYKVLGTVGKGVFSTVLKCSDNAASSQRIVAIKCVRSNETMSKAAQTEIEILQIFQKNPHPHIVPMLFPTPQHPVAEHKGHKLMVFEFYSYNLRDVLQKFGKGVGLSLVSVRMYYGQLLSALHHMQMHSIVHADIKLDNMLVTDDFTTVKMCDFGSAMDMKDSGNAIPTPYLVSRFYRAPEIILGHTPAYTMDLWSVAATIAELFLGRVLFNGTSNNDMLLKIMQVLGPLPLKQIKHHTNACRTYPLPQHFSEHHFLQQAKDTVTGKPIQKSVSLQQFPSTPLQSLLLKAKSSSDSRVQVLQLSDLLKKCCALDPTRRIALKDAMKHEFFQRSSEQGANSNSTLTSKS